MSRDDMSAQIRKLNEAQRAALRMICRGDLDEVTVEKLGWMTAVTFVSYGYRYSVKLGPKGRVISRDSQPA